MNVVGYRAGQGADRNILDLARDIFHSSEVFRRGVRISGFYNVHSQLRKLPRNAQLLAASEAGSAACSPSRNVVSNTYTFSCCINNILFELE